MLIVPTTDGEAIEQFSLRVAEAWKIGRRKIDDGALLVIAKNDRHLRIEVGYGLEGALTDVTTKRIIDEDITPKFKSGDFAGGITAGVGRIVRVIDGEKLPAPEPEHWNNPGISDYIDPFNPVVIIGVLILGALLRAILGRLVGSTATAGLVGFFVWIVAGSLAAAALLAVIAFVISLFADAWSSVNPGMGRGGYRRGTSFPGGGGGWGGGSGDGGGFSGGGGNFGGAARRGAGKVMGIKRISRHLIEHRWRLRRLFPKAVLDAIEQAIKSGEATHRGQVRFVVEGALDGAPLLRDQPARERALDVFSHLRIWDTAHNNGVLIYLLLADRDVEIVADRGIHAKVGAEGWEAICRMMEADFRGGHFQRGVIEGIEAVSRELAKHFPADGPGPNELPDAPVVL